MISNNLFGMANKKLLCLLEDNDYYEKLTDMAAINDYRESQKKNSGLESVLKKKQVRGFLASPAQALVDDGTINEVTIKPLRALIPKCEFILIETTDY